MHGDPRQPATLKRRFFRLTAINVASNVTVPLAGLVDTALLGHLPDIRFLAGVALASLLFDYVYWSFGFLRMGTTGTTAQAVGAQAADRGESDEVYRVLWRSLLLAAALAAAVVALQVPLAEVGFALLAGEAPVEAAGRDYFFARVWGAPATLANFALLGWFLGREEAGRALAMTVTANLANILLDAWFILGLGMAARGAGLATALSQYAQLAVALWLLWRAVGRDFPQRRRKTESAGPLLPGWTRAAVFDRAKLGELVRLNTDILVRTLCLVSSFAVFLNLSSVLGTAVLAANTILMRLFYLAAYAIDGAAFATESLAGIFRGAGEGGGLRRLERLALASGVGFCALFLSAVFVAPRQVLGLLTSHRDVVETALGVAPWLIPVLLVGAAAFVYDGLFLGLTEGRALRNSMLFSTLVVFLPAAGAAWWSGSNHLLWAALALFMVARAGTLGWASRRLVG